MTDLEQFRLELYEVMSHRRDALLDLIDAVASNTFARSVIELSLSPLFRRQYSSVPDALDNFFQATAPELAIAGRRIKAQALMGLIGPYLPPPQARPFWLWGIDVIPIPRQFAHTLADRTYVYQPNTLSGNKPVTIGHQASVLAYLPEKGEAAPPWLVPFIISRVGSSQTKNELGVEQVKQLFSDETLPYAQVLNVLVGDSDYSSVFFLGPLADYDHLIVVSRAASNRVLYRQPTPLPPDQQPGRGHPSWYGQPFRLKDPRT